MNKTKVLIFSLTLAAAPVLCAQTVPSVPDNTARILTPPPQTAPRINGPSVFGVRPGHPILYRVPVTGDKPITYSASGLPKGVSFDRATGQLSGVVANEGTYKIALRASNARGKHERLFRLVVGDTVALTPPMGWNSYNVWSDQITQERALAAARAMVSTGLVEHGWSYINMDDGWQGVRGGDLKALQPDARRFPDMKGTIDQIHGMGLKAGIYSSPWVITYANRLGGSAENPEGAAQRWPPGASHNKRQLPYAIGKYHFTQNDAKQFAVFGIDYLKYDWGPVEYPETKEMYDALHVLDRDIIFSLSNNHEQNLFDGIGEVSAVANAWRTTTDISDNWKRVADDIGFNQEKWAPFARPGHYNDADMLVVGVVGWGAARQHPTKLTVDEQFSHLSLWALLSSPLLLGCDLERLDAFTLSLLTNDEVIAVNQDALVKQAVGVSRQDGREVYRKELEDGSIAVGLFNRGPAEGTVSAKWTDLKITGKQIVRDLWRQKDVGVFESSYFTPLPLHPTGSSSSGSSRRAAGERMEPFETLW